MVVSFLSCFNVFAESSSISFSQSPVVGIGNSPSVLGLDGSGALWLEYAHFVDAANGNVLWSDSGKDWSDGYHYTHSVSPTPGNVHYYFSIAFQSNVGTILSGSRFRASFEFSLVQDPPSGDLGTNFGACKVILHFYDETTKSYSRASWQGQGIDHGVDGIYSVDFVIPVDCYMVEVQYWVVSSGSPLDESGFRLVSFDATDPTVTQIEQIDSIRQEIILNNQKLDSISSRISFEANEDRYGWDSSALDSVASRFSSDSSSVHAYEELALSSLHNSWNDFNFPDTDPLTSSDSYGFISTVLSQWWNALAPFGLVFLLAFALMIFNQIVRYR